MQSAPGSYALLFHCAKAVEVAVGRLGHLQLEPGYYIYLGSAFGPGGVRARTEHHRRISKKPHWHLDTCAPICISSRSGFHSTLSGVNTNGPVKFPPCAALDSRLPGSAQATVAARHTYSDLGTNPRILDFVFERWNQHMISF